MGMYASVGDVANDLMTYGEDVTAEWIAACSEDEFRRVRNVADFLVAFGPTQGDGSSMLIAKALALAAVYVCEGTPRQLNRERRDLSRTSERYSALQRPSVMDVMMEIGDPFEGVGDDLVESWARSPADARAQIAAAGQRRD
ncbi:MAG: hypothetical protein ACTHKX_01005 [Pseudolysinimonas sp.]